MRRLPTVLLIAAILLCTEGCGGSGQSTGTATAPDPASVVSSGQRSVTFPELKQAIARLYRREPAIRTFVARDVEYTPRTRDRVLAVCRHGGPEVAAAARESSRIAGCAPLIFFFFSYGRRRSVPESVDVARQIYWYAAGSIHGPFDARKTLTGLLQSWGVP